MEGVTSVLFGSIHSTVESALLVEPWEYGRVALGAGERLTTGSNGRVLGPTVVAGRPVRLLPSSVAVALRRLVAVAPHGVDVEATEIAWEWSLVVET